MTGLLGLLALSFAAMGLVATAAGLRWLQVDARLRSRIDGQVGRGLSGISREKAAIRLPSVIVARGRDRNEIEQKLRSAGYFQPSAIEVFAWLRLVTALAAGLASIVACFIITGDPFKPIFAPLAATGLTYVGAKYVLHIRANTRVEVLTTEFPFLLDLMLMMLESGVSLDQCFRSIAREERVAVPNHARLVAMLIDDLDRGQDYPVAFDRWATRVGVSGSRELAALFRQSLFQGMELVPALREFIREFSQRRVARAREAIGKITVKMVVLMLVFFMPALFIVLAGPPVASILDTLRSGN
jgi:tight adherence protein C